MENIAHRPKKLPWEEWQYQLIHVDVKGIEMNEYPLGHDLGFFPSTRAASAKHVVSLLRFFHCNYTWPRGSRCPGDHPYRMSALMGGSSPKGSQLGIEVISSHGEGSKV